MQTKKIGLRPGEKIDEVLISENEMTDTYQIKNGYVLISNKSYYSSKLKKKLKKINLHSEYNSRKNSQFLTKSKIFGFLKNNGF